MAKFMYAICVSWKPTQKYYNWPEWRIKIGYKGISSANNSQRMEEFHKAIKYIGQISQFIFNSKYKQ